MTSEIEVIKHNNTKIQFSVENLVEALSNMPENTKITLRLDDIRCLFEDFSEKTRLELIKSLIWTAPSAQSMWQLVCEEICNDKFGSEID